MVTFTIYTKYKGSITAIPIIKKAIQVIEIIVTVTISHMFWDHSISILGKRCLAKKFDKGFISPYASISGCQFSFYRRRCLGCVSCDSCLIIHTIIKVESHICTLKVRNICMCNNYLRHQLKNTYCT